MKQNAQTTVIGPLNAISKYLLGTLAIVSMLCAAACSNSDLPGVEAEIDPALGQVVFASPEDAANSFFLALTDGDKEMLEKILGADYAEVLPLDDVDADDVALFSRAWDQHHTLLPQGNNKRLIAVGADEWTLPIPILSGTAGWYFDVDEGRERMRIRRIGRNELAAMQAVLAYYDAQMEYAEQDRNGNGMLEYAQRLISTAGTHDGLYWETGSDEPLSPLGPLVADHTPGGGYHGYYYQILAAQGDHARDGAYSYLIGDQMRAGFALIAWPQVYGDSGVMSFMVSHAGIVYERNLGPDSAKIAQAMLTFDPDPDVGWTLAQEVNAPEVSVDR